MTNKANVLEKAEELMSRSMMKKHFLGKVCKQNTWRYKRFYLVISLQYIRDRKILGHIKIQRKKESVSENNRDWYGCVMKVK